MKSLALPVTAAFLALGLTSAIPAPAVAGAGVTLDRQLAKVLDAHRGEAVIEKVHKRKRYHRKYRRHHYYGAPYHFGYGYYRPYRYRYYDEPYYYPYGYGYRSYYGGYGDPYYGYPYPGYSIGFGFRW